jgi:hypothetical protein
MGDTGGPNTGALKKAIVTPKPNGIQAVGERAKAMDPTSDQLAEYYTPGYADLSDEQKGLARKKYEYGNGASFAEIESARNQWKDDYLKEQLKEDGDQLVDDANKRKDIERKNEEAVAAGEVERRRIREVKSKRTFLGYTPVEPYKGPKKTLLGM